jgi:RNA polymerase sigma factor (sigma-70 family)
MAQTTRRYPSDDLHDCPPRLRALLRAPYVRDVPAELLPAFAPTCDPAARTALVEFFAPLVLINASVMRRRHFDFYPADSFGQMIADGMFGLLRAVHLADNPATFSSYARTWICTSIRRGRREALGMRRPSDRIIAQERERFIQAEGRLPTRQELLKRVGQHISNPNIQIGEAPPIAFSQLETEAHAFVSYLADQCTESPDQRLLDRETVKLAMKGLKPTDRKILKLLLRGQNQADIARRLGLSKQRVHQRLNGVLWEARSRADLARHLDVEPTARPITTAGGQLASMKRISPARMVG